MQAEESLKTPKSNSTNLPKPFEPLPKEKPHGKIYLAAQKFKDTMRNKMKNFLERFDFDDKDDTSLFMALMIPE